MSAPAWFDAALADLPRHGDVDVDGRRVHTRTWGQPSERGVVLVHGGAAHSGWWDHVAPLLTEGRQVVALDMTGHGDSSHEQEYGVERWADEVDAVARAAGLVRPVVVGHSMGGWVAFATAGRHPDLVAGVVVLDSPLFDRPPEEERLAHRRKPTRVYASLDQALGRFATIPPQDVVLPHVGRHVAEQSLRQVEGGWTWKFDPGMFGQRPPLRALLPQIACPVALFRSQLGLLTAQMTAEMGQLLPQAPAVVELPDTGHHPMLDRPLVLVAALRTQLAAWGA
ncbi:MAG: alpha/beta hydrolase [Frankiales bacterium]|nr:alpha/beta hydrolase [Frankiales bacterium]